MPQLHFVDHQLLLNQLHGLLQHPY
ncbi:hypothetical protein E2C01_100258 [Portunus trituberculatus]|uniref:Uncharacterized protein n=1 Tax=Portunus trituberculatus TaxID=210409 RepID=A0A5B7KCW2_PORTR|nr:hypothetical protein [Portunus trituberculatus]